MNPEVGEALFQALYDRDSWVRARAAGALGEIAYVCGGLPGDVQRTVDRLAEILVEELLEDTKEPWASAFHPAMRALGDIGPGAKSAVPILRQMMRESIGSITVGYCLARILPDSSEGLDHLRKSARQGNMMACISIGQLGVLGRDAREDVEKNFRADNDFTKKVKNAVLVAISGERSWRKSFDGWR